MSNYDDYDRHDKCGCFESSSEDRWADTVSLTDGMFDALVCACECWDECFYLTTYVGRCHSEDEVTIGFVVADRETLFNYLTNNYHKRTCERIFKFFRQCSRDSLGWNEVFYTYSQRMKPKWLEYVRDLEMERDDEFNEDDDNGDEE